MKSFFNQSFLQKGVLFMTLFLFEITVCFSQDTWKPTVEFCITGGVGTYDIAPTKIWDKNFSGGPMQTVEFDGNTVSLGVDELVRVLRNSDKSYTLFGKSNSSAGNFKTEGNRGNSGKMDFWIVKIDEQGNKIWDKTLGGLYTDNLVSVVHSFSDSSYVIVGNTNSPMGFDVGLPFRNEPYGDIWVIKINQDGNKVWEKRIGTGYGALASDIIATPDGGYFIAASTEAGIGFDKSVASKGSYDMWLIKIDGNGNKIWDKVYGGASTDYVASISKAEDGFLLCGYIYSQVSGDVSEPERGGADYWVMKVDFNGNKIWNKRYGGSSSDFLTKSIKVPGGYLLGGSTYSGLGGDKTVAKNGLWIIKIDENGNKIWDKVFGNGSSDNLNVLSIYNDSTYLVGGTVNRSYGFGDDFYINKLSVNGDLVWEKFIGSKGRDKLADVLFLENEGILLAGTTTGHVAYSNDRSESTILDDYWLVKVQTCKSVSNPLVINQGDSITLKIATNDMCGYERVMWSNNVIGNTVTVNPNHMTEYSARCYDPTFSMFGNESSKLTVIVNCGETLDLLESNYNLSQIDGTVRAERKINASNILTDSKVFYQAGESITLLPGFEAPINRVFKAQIGNCN